MHVYYDFQNVQGDVVCIIFAKKSDVNTADAATMKTARNARMEPNGACLGKASLTRHKSFGP